MNTGIARSGCFWLFIDGTWGCKYKFEGLDIISISTEGLQQNEPTYLHQKAAAQQPIPRIALDICIVGVQKDGPTIAWYGQFA